MGSASRTNGTKRDCRVSPMKAAGNAIMDAARVLVRMPILLNVVWVVRALGKGEGGRSGGGEGT